MDSSRSIQPGVALPRRLSDQETEDRSDGGPLGRDVARQSTLVQGQESGQPQLGSSPSRSSARSEASAKMRATLSASSSPAEASAARFAAPVASFSAVQMKQPGSSSDNSSSQPNAHGLAVPIQSPTLEHHSTWSDANRGETYLEVPGPSGSAPPALSGDAAPLMSASGRTASSPGSAAAQAPSHGPASVNGRIRASTSSVTPTSSHASMLSPSFPPSGQPARTSPRMRAQVGPKPPPIPSLGAGAMGSMMSPALASFPLPHHVSSHPNAMSVAAYERHTAELTNCIIAFLSPILPTEEEYRIKEATRRQLERLASKVSPGAKLLAFGSMANGFALRNSDMDLCCLIGKKDGQPTTQHTASELVEILSQLIREETDFNVMPLPKARIPIIKISRAPTPDLPYEISCDIGFENRLALENTRLLLSYAMVDPPRLRTLVLFLKVWTKRRKLNSPYTGTLSSYGYTLLALFFLTHVKRPAVLPNLQRIPPTRPLRPEELELNGNNIYFYDDVATLRKEWSSQNTENVGELLIDFFRYFSKEFSYSKDVISLRTEGGLLSKDSKSWAAELCIEDPFQMGYNVSRTVTKDGLYTIRGEFMRATRILTNSKSHRVSALIAELCEEREDGLSRAPDAPYQRPRPSYQHGPAGMDSRPYRDVYARRYDPPTFSGYGGSFAFEQMARGLGQGIAFPPTTAMLAPLSRTHGLSPKPHAPRFANQTEAMISSGQSDTGVPSSYDSFSRASIGHASARTSPSFKHAVPNGIHSSGGPNAQEAFAYGAEISFGPEHVSTTRDDTGGPRTKTARSLSESLNRSKSLPRAAAAAAVAGSTGDGGAGRHGAASFSAGLPAGLGSYLVAPGTTGSSPSDELEGAMTSLSVQPTVEPTRRLSNASHASSSMQSDSITGPHPQYVSTSPNWSFAHAGAGQRRGSQSTFHHHPPPHGPLHFQHQQTHQQHQQSSPYHHPTQQQHHHQPHYHHHHQQNQHASPAASSTHPAHPSQQAEDQLQLQAQETRAMLQECLRRASANAELDVRAYASDNDDASSVISEATLDELARISELESSETASPQLGATASGKIQGLKNASPQSSTRLPDSILQQAKARRKAHPKAAPVAAASTMPVGPAPSDAPAQATANCAAEEK